ncbi:glyoxylate/hydroxypyruvate reductase A [Litoribacter alkaliphilus]|uniref:Glyoxylate/hydroxypyruvate reductase A n=1 Tax=Litoribacter ruber TaxID=702568 RepID=A0AAP2CMF7_9BACT|nr:glyoxylate/hydroxypyruvate reductase A [Litoribacter alkaliphilus]MBS9524577.1 glyoxylate/hydroxypyruvate reductase A [Litoribacter alkaliphilus]
MNIAIIAPGRDVTVWKETIEKEAKGVNIQVYPEISSPENVDMVMLWQHPKGILKKFTNLKFISSMGAGVDHILNDPYLPEGIPVARIKDEKLTFSMTNYVVMGVLNFHRRLSHFQENQKKKRWDMKNPEIDVKVGVMGVGALGGDVLDKLSYMGFDVYGYGNSPKEDFPFTYFHGKEGLKSFLDKVNVIACLLPLTEQTEGFLNSDFFEDCQKGTYLINVARGKHLVEEDLIKALKKGHISGTLLDVYSKEPLPKDHPFWDNEKITMTPHIASVTNPLAAAPKIAENCRRWMEGKPLRNVVNQEKGY